MCLSHASKKSHVVVDTETGRVTIDTYFRDMPKFDHPYLSDEYVTVPAEKPDPVTEIRDILKNYEENRANFVPPEPFTVKLDFDKGKAEIKQAWNQTPPFNFLPLPR